MSLGSIAHLQYYFARTGLLDGKGAQLARDKKKGSRDSMDNRVSILDPTTNSDNFAVSSLGGDLAQSPIEEEHNAEEYWDDPDMLPPTVSTYIHKTQYIAPPPDTESLRKELKDALDHVTKALTDVREEKKSKNEDIKPSGDELLSLSLDSQPDSDDSLLPGQRSPGRGWHEIQGMHVLDVVTMAIRAAKDYYTMHENPQRLSKVKTERQLREELLGVMDVLKRMGSRNFAGGMKDEEISTIENWISSVILFLSREKDAEAREIEDRESWQWLEGEWAPGDRRREWLFMKTFIESEELPEWTDPIDATALPTPFLQSLGNGLTLVHLHNRILKKSRRQFGDIKTFHTDTAKPYRAADNLRYWIKAAEIRWETKLLVDVMGVVYNRGDEVWKQLDNAILQWCRVVRDEITKEWKAGAVEVGYRS